MDVEKDNIKYLIKDMKKLKKAWKTVLEESKKKWTENEITPEYFFFGALKMLIALGFEVSLWAPAYMYI